MGAAEDVFEGQPSGLPEPVPRGRALYRPVTAEPAKVRHVGGYGPFIEFCTGRGVRAKELAADPERLISFLRATGAEIGEDSTLSSAAAVFTGNTIADLRPEAHWTAYEGAPPLVGNRHKQFDVDRLLVALRTADDDSVRGFVSELLGWAGEDTDESPALRPAPVPPAAGQPRYVRPDLPAATYYSSDGQPIPYGRHWDGDGPDPDAYGVDSHPERFAGLHVVARALIGHLVLVYDVDVDVDAGPGPAGDLLLEVRDVLHAVRLTPRRPQAAPLTFVLTGYPGVVVHAGVLHDFPFPV